MATKKLTEEQKAANKAAKAKAAAKPDQTNQESNAAKTQNTNESGQGQNDKVSEVTGQATQTGTEIQGAQDPAGSGLADFNAGAGTGIDPERQRLQASGKYASLHGAMPPAEYSTEQIINLNEERVVANDRYTHLFGRDPQITYTTDQLHYWNNEREQAARDYANVFGQPPYGIDTTDEISNLTATRNQLFDKYASVFGERPDVNHSDLDILKAIEEKEISIKAEKNKEAEAAAKKQQEEEDANHIMAVNAAGEKKRFTKATWAFLIGDKGGWKEEVKTPKEVQELKNKS